MPFLGVAWSFLAGGAWKWAIPVAGMALALGWGAWERDGWRGCEAAAATFRADAERQVRDFKEADRVNGNRLADEHAAAVADIQGKLANAKDKLAAVVSDPACANSAAARAFDDSLRQ